MRRQSRHQLRPGGPALGREQRLGRFGPQGLAKQGEAQSEVAGDGVSDPRHTQQPRSPAPRPAQLPRHVPGELELLGDDEVRPRLQPLHHLVQGVGVVDEVGVQRDGAVALGAVGALQREPQQLFDARGVAAPLPVGEHGQREDFGVGGQHLAGAVGRRVVAHEELVLALERREYLADFPEHQPDRPGFIAYRHTDVDHGPAI